MMIRTIDFCIRFVFVSLGVSLMTPHLPPLERLLAALLLTCAASVR